MRFIINFVTKRTKRTTFQQLEKNMKQFNLTPKQKAVQNARKLGHTSRARIAIGEFVNDNVDQMSDWLQRVANGLPKLNADGEVIRDSDGSVVWVNKPDAAGALKALADLAEYHLPKLSRAEVAATVEHTDPALLSTEQLQRRLLVSLGLTAEDAEILPSVPSSVRLADAAPVSTGLADD